MLNIKQEKRRLVWVGVGINFALRDPCYEEFLWLNKVLVQKYGSTHIFDPAINQPHLNLYDIDVPADSLEKIESVLQSLAKRTKPFEISFEKVDAFDFGTIFVSCRQNDALNQLERDAVREITGFRDGCKTEYYWKPRRNYSQAQMENRAKYGNPLFTTAYG